MGLIYLIRHAEPAITGVLLGSLDPPLVAPPAKSHLNVRSVYSSPLRRAYETASALFPGQPIVKLENLTEISLGKWDGLAWEEIERRDPELAATKLRNWFDVTAPGGEGHASILARARGGLQTIQAATRPVAVVAHSGINAILWHLLSGHPIQTFRQDYLEVKTYESLG